MALTKKCPIVTPVADGVWVMYPPKPGELVRGGYPAHSAQEALAATSHIALRVWGIAPIIVSREITKSALAQEGAPE
jgi:hypothetical protein